MRMLTDDLTDDISQCLAWKWNWFRQSLVESSRDFAALAEQSSAAGDSAIWRGFEDECQGLAHRLADILRSADLPAVRIHKPLQWFFRRHYDAATFGSEVDRVSAVRVVLWRLFRQMENSLKADGVSGEILTDLLAAARDLRSLVDQLSDWLERRPGAEAQHGLDQSREVDRLVVHELRPFEEVLWQLPGLGRSRDVAAV